MSMPALALALMGLDVDGVLTNGSKWYDETGKLVAKSFSDLDFTAIKCFQCSGVRVVFISGDTRVNEAVARSRHLEFYHSRSKHEVLDRLTLEMGISPDQVGFVGDDMFDLEAVRYAGFGFCPSNAPSPLKQACSVKLKGRSGEGLMMEIFEYFVTLGLLAFPTPEQLRQLRQFE